MTFWPMLRCSLWFILLNLLHLCSSRRLNEPEKRELPLDVFPLHPNAHPKSKSSSGVSFQPFDCENTDHGHRIATCFVNKKGLDRSFCPEESWLKTFADFDPVSDKFLVNIGVNKGYNIAFFLDAFAPILGVNPGSWYQSLLPLATQHNVHSICGICKDCNSTIDRSDSSESDRFNEALSVLSHHTFLLLDLNCVNIKLLKEVLVSVASKYPAFSRMTTFYPICAGASNVSSEVYINCSPGYEACGFALEGKTAGAAPVPIVTVDQLMTQFLDVVGQAHHFGKKERHSATSRLQHKVYFQEISATKPYQPIIDILIIDTEGYDYPVLQGAKQLLRSRSVRVVMFEYHKSPPWNQLKLEDAQKELVEMGYDCFFAGQNRLWKMSGPTCWDPVYEFHIWSNIFCVRREDAWFPLIQKYIVKTPPPGC